MTTTIIRFDMRVNGVLVDATSVVFDDPTSTFGVRRTDTGAIVVAAGIALTHTGTGTYQYSFIDPAPGLIYNYWIKFVYQGNTYRVEQNQSGVGVAVGLAEYTTLAAMKQWGPMEATTFDALMSSIITGVSRALDNECGPMQFAYQSYVDAQYDAAIDVDGMLEALVNVPRIDAITAAAYKPGNTLVWNNIDPSILEIENFTHGSMVHVVKNVPVQPK